MSKDTFRELARTLKERLALGQPASVAEARRGALDRFVAMGLPTTRDEDWKYTNVMPLERRAFHFTALAPDGVTHEQIDELRLGDSHLLTFINGHYHAGLSRVGALPAGATAASLHDVTSRDGDAYTATLAQQTFANGFAALNTALWADGALIDLAPGVEVERPIHLLYFSTEPELAMHLRNVIRLGRDARVTVIEHYFGVDAYLTNSVTSIAAGAGAAIEHCKLQQEAARAYHIGSIDVEQAAGSRFASHSFAVGGQLSRTDISTRFNAPGCEAKLNGLYLAKGRQHVDHHTLIDHASPHGTSREFYKGVLDDGARGVFNGRVIVRPDAQKTNAHQTNRNLLLSESAEIDTKPQLEIYADDVKCTHGATVGQLDENHLFYLRSRGLSRGDAKSILTYAFAAEPVHDCPIAPLKNRLIRLLLAGLPGAALIENPA